MHISNPLCAIIGIAPMGRIESPCQGSRVPESIWNTCSSENALYSTRLVLKQRLRHERRVRLDISRFLKETSVRFISIFVRWIQHLQGTVTVPSRVQLELPCGSKGICDGRVNLYLTGLDPELIVHAANLLTHVRRNERREGVTVQGWAYVMLRLNTKPHGIGSPSLLSHHDKA